MISLHLTWNALQRRPLTEIQFYMFFFNESFIPVSCALQVRDFTTITTRSHMTMQPASLAAS